MGYTADDFYIYAGCGNIYPSFEKYAYYSNTAGRDIVFTACNWGSDDVHSWIRETGADLFRSTGDIQDSWESVKRLALSQIGNECYGGVYCHNDMDILLFI